MNNDQELEILEKEWKSRFDRFTAPEPSREMTLELIKRIKEAERDERPVDLRKELEEAQYSLSTKEKIANLFLSQWNFYGAKTWLLTGLVMAVITFTISENSADAQAGFLSWIKWMTLIVIAVIGYAFRPENEGNEMLETLSYYPLTLQLFTRFMIVVGFQFVLTLPLSFVVLGKEATALYLVSTFMPVFFFGAFGFAGTFWLGPKAGLFLTLVLWFSQVFVKKKILFQAPGDEHFLIMNLALLGLSVLLISTTFLRNRFMEKWK